MPWLARDSRNLAPVFSCISLLLSHSPRHVFAGLGLVEAHHGHEVRGHAELGGEGPLHMRRLPHDAGEVKCCLRSDLEGGAQDIQWKTDIVIITL